MTHDRKFKFKSKISIGILLVFFLLIILKLSKDQFTRDAIVSIIQKGDIRDSVSGNVMVLADRSFQLKSETQAKLEFAALIPYGKSISVDQNQTLFLMNTEDLDWSLKSTKLSKSTHAKKLKTGSSLLLKLELEEKNLESLRTIAEKNSNDISEFELESKINLVEGVRRQFELEKISNEETSNSLDLEIERIEHELEKRKILSPIKGTLVSSNVKRGDTIFVGQVLGEIQSDERIIEVSLNEEDFVGIIEGQNVDVTIFSFGNTIFKGVVNRLSVNVDPISGRRKVFVKLLTEKFLPAGSSGRAEIIKREIKAATIMPRKALLGNSVFTVRNGKATLVDIEVGARNLEFVEIIRGLEPKEMVISKTPHLFHDGENVSPIILK